MFINSSCCVGEYCLSINLAPSVIASDNRRFEVGAIITLGLIILIGYFIFREVMAHKITQRKRYIDDYIFPSSIRDKVLQTYPHLTTEQGAHVIHCLREYFHLCNMAQNSTVSMPSQAVDVAWHEFILFTKLYERFCKHAFTTFLHHTPAEAMKSPTLAQEGIKTAWRLSCRREKLVADHAARLPLLFAIDAQLAIPDGFNYVLDCSSSQDFCGGHIGCSSGGDNSSDGYSDSSGDSSGCSGSSD